MYFSNNLFILLLLFASGHGAPSNGKQLAAEENEEIKDSEDFMKVFKEDQLKAGEELDKEVSVEQTVGGTDVTEETHGVSETDVTEGVSPTTEPSWPSTSLDQSTGEEEGIPTTTVVGEELQTESVNDESSATKNVDDETSDAKSSPTTTFSNKDASQESDKVQGGSSGLVTTSSETDLPAKETTLNGVTSKSEGNEPHEPEGSKAPESELSGAAEPSENESIKTETTISSFDSNSSIMQAGTSGNNSEYSEDNPDPNNESELNNDNSESSNEDSEVNNSTNTEDYVEAINQFQNQDFSKGTTVLKEESVTWKSMTSTGEGSLYLGPSIYASSGADSGQQVDDKEQQEEEGEAIDESRSLLSRWWLWLLMLCLGLGLGLLCRSRINGKQGEAEYLRMGERHQGSTITIPR